MSSWTPDAIVTHGLMLWLGILTVFIVWQLFRRRIDLSGLLQGDRANGETFFSPGRVQLLIATIYAAGHLLLQVIANPAAFPHIPPELLVGLGGSHAIYLGGKARALLG